MRKVIQEIHGVIDVIELNKRSIECQNGKRFLWTVSIFMQTPFPEGGMEIEQSKIDQFQQGGNLKFDELIIRDFASNASDLSDSDPLTVNKKIDIRSTTANKTYKILGQKIN